MSYLIEKKVKTFSLTLETTQGCLPSLLLIKHNYEVLACAGKSKNKVNIRNGKKSFDKI